MRKKDTVVVNWLLHYTLKSRWSSASEKCWSCSRIQHTNKTQSNHDRHHIIKTLQDSTVQNNTVGKVIIYRQHWQHLREGQRRDRKVVRSGRVVVYVSPISSRTLRGASASCSHNTSTRDYPWLSRSSVSPFLISDSGLHGQLCSSYNSTAFWAINKWLSSHCVDCSSPTLSISRTPKRN